MVAHAMCDVPFVQENSRHTANIVTKMLSYLRGSINLSYDTKEQTNAVTWELFSVILSSYTLQRYNTLAVVVDSVAVGQQFFKCVLVYLCSIQKLCGIPCV